MKRPSSRAHALSPFSSAPALPSHSPIAAALQRGSVSAEHGMGLSKAAYLPMSKTEGMIRLMRGIKQLFDPNGILNPYKVLPTEKRKKEIPFKKGE